MSNRKLSDRIINECQELTDRLMKIPYITEFLVKGNVTNGKELASKTMQFWMPWIDEWTAIFEFGLEKAETPDEKQFFKSIVENARQICPNYTKSFEQAFGEQIDTRLLSEPLPLNIWSYKQNYLKEASFGSVVEILIIALAIFWTTYLLRFDKYKPNFKPNPYYDWFLSDGEATIQLVDTIKQLLDNKASMISAEKEEKLIWLFKRSLIYETLFMDTVWNKDWWHIF